MESNIVTLGKNAELVIPSVCTKLTDQDEIRAGDIFTDGRNEEIFRLVRFEEGQYPRWIVELLISVSPLEWGQKEKKYDNSTLKQYYKRVDPAFFNEGHTLYLQFVNTGTIPETTSQDEEISETALVAPKEKFRLEEMQESLVIKSKRAEAMRLFVMAEMEVQKRRLEGLRRVLEGQLAIFQKEIKKIYRVIQTIELYLGIEEELIQIQEGPTAPVDEPVTLRQQMLFMDEEVAVFENGGLDINDIPVFEAWLLKDKNYEKLVPEKKCVVVMKPRRFRKEYGNDRVNDAMAKWNKTTYLLIRNGDNIYRINSENLAVSQRLFPKREELSTLREKMEKETFSRFNQEDFEDLFDEYRRLMVLIQGLIDRSTVFAPMHPGINIFNMDDIQHAVRFIYDDENLLPTGRLPFWDWHKSINSTIVKGSRILLSDHFEGNRFAGRDEYKRRLYYYCNDYNVPSYQIQAFMKYMKSL